MSTIKLHYDGWLPLPTDIRLELGLKTGDQLLAELREGAITLRLATKSGEFGMLDPHGPQQVSIQRPAVDVAVPVKRKPGRPRKIAIEPEVQPATVVTVKVPWRIRRKADLQPAARSDQPAFVPHREPLLEMGGGYERAERHPFRHVEVRKLGPRMRPQ